MSYDVSAYSCAEAQPNGKDLSERLATGGWSVAYVEPRDHSTAPSEPLSDCMVIAWRSGPATDAAVAQALAEPGDQTLDTLYERNMIGSLMLNYDSKVQFLRDIDDPEERALAGMKAHALMKQARHLYSTTTSMGRNTLSLRAQTALCLALASLFGGVVVDPQYALYLRIPARPSLPGSPGVLRKLFAMARGYIRVARTA